MLKIEKLRHEDIESVVQISSQQFGANGWQTELFVNELGLENHWAFVVKIDDEVVAFAFLMKTFGQRGEDFNLLNIATKKGHENQGIGTELFLFLTNFAKGMGVYNMWLEVREGNYNAITFYKNLGFELDYVRKKYYADGENALVMNLVLN